MELQEIVEALCEVDGAIGAVVCDYEGETVVAALGAAAAPPEAEARAREHMPRAMAVDMHVTEFLVRLAGAEPCGLLRVFGDLGAKRGAGALETLEIRYEEVELLVRRLPNDFYVVLVLRRPAVTAVARKWVEDAGKRLAEHVA